MNTSLRLYCAALLAFLAVAFTSAGCGGGNPLGRLPISGEVSWNGKPIAVGSIEFSPVGGEGVPAGETIRQGKYEIERLKGLPPGEYIVRIYSSTVSTAPLTPEEAAMPEVHRPGVELIPAKFNRESELKAVVAANATEFNFHLTNEGLAER